MNTRKLRGFVFACLALAWSYRVEPLAAEPKMVPTSVQRLVFDFSDSPNGGVPGGKFENVAVVLTEAKPVQRFALGHDEHAERVIPSFDYAGCVKGQERLLEQSTAGLPPGDAVWVDYVEVEMQPSTQKDLEWSGGVCYGYRSAGTWHWHLATVPLARSLGSDRVFARFWVKEGNVDALKLVFDWSVPRLPIRRFTIVTLPREQSLPFDHAGAH